LSTHICRRNFVCALLSARNYPARLCLLTSWWCSILVRLLVLGGELSLSCARLMAGRVTTLWVKRPLPFNQHGQLSQPSLRGRLMSSNPSMMGYESGDLLLACAACAGGRAAARSLWVQAEGGGLSSLAAQFSDKSTLEVCIHVMHYKNRRRYLFTKII